MKNHKTALRMTALALGVFGVVSVASASGFQIRENSIKSLGRAFSGTTTAQQDATVAISNPAAMVNIDRTTVSQNLSLIDMNGDFTGSAIAGAPFAASTNLAVKALARPVTGGNGGDPGDLTPVPSFAAVMPLHGAFENMTIGFGVNAPFGLKTEWEKDWVGRYNAVTSDVKVIDATLSAAWKVNDEFSLGASFIFQQADVTLTNALDLGTAVCSQLSAGAGTAAGLAAFSQMCLAPTAPYKPGANDGFFSVSGKDNGIGYSLGMLWKPTANLSMGYNYKSEIDHELKGDVEFTIPANVMALPGMSARFASGKGGALLTTPSTHTFSAQYNITPTARVMGEYQRTGWSSLRSVDIKRDTGVVIGQEAFNWSDSNMYSLGGDVDLSPAFTLRAGIGRDETPTHDSYRSPRLPDNDRTLLSIGGTWNVNDRMSLDVAYMRVNLKDSPLYATSSTGTLFTGKVEGGANIFGIGGQIKF